MECQNPTPSPLSLRQNANFTNSLVAGIIKAGDGGSGSRARDGEGGNDSSNGAPYNGTFGDGTGGSKGDRGIAAHFGMLTEGSQATATVDRSIVVPSDNGTPGKQGNNGWGGMNLQRIYYDHSNQVKRHAEFHGGTYYGHSSSTTQTRQIGFIVYNFDSVYVAYGRHVAIGPLGGEYGAANNSKVKDYTNALFFYTEDDTSWLNSQVYTTPPHNTYNNGIVLYTILKCNFHYVATGTGSGADIILEAYIIETPASAVCR